MKFDWVDDISHISDIFESQIMELTQNELKALIHIATIYKEEDQ